MGTCIKVTTKAERFNFSLLPHHAARPLVSGVIKEFSPKEKRVNIAFH